MIPSPHKMTRSQIFKVVKWCVKWSATAGGLFIANYIFNGFQLVGVVTILGILFIFSVMLAPRSEQIKAIKFFPIFFCSYYYAILSTEISIYWLHYQSIFIDDFSRNQVSSVNPETWVPCIYYENSFDNISAIQ